MFFYSVCFSFFSIYLLFSFFLLPFIGFPGFPSHPKTPKKNENSKIQIPKSRSKSVEACLPSTCVCPPVCPIASSPKAQTFEPPLTIHFDEKIGLFAPYFFPVIKAAVFFSVPFIGFPITAQNAPPKKWREFPLGAPSPCGKTGLAPCRQCTFSIFLHSFFGYFSRSIYSFYVFPIFFHLFFFFFVCRSLNFPSHPKTRPPTKKTREFPLGGPSPCGTTGLAPCRQCMFSSFFG